MPPTLRIRLLGPVRIDVDDVPLAVDTRKAVALLAYLAVTGRPASRESLAALLWPESGVDEARGALRRTLSVLNGGLGGVGLEIDRTAVALDPKALDVDLSSFRQALAEVRTHGDPADAPCPRCLALLDGAAALDRGEFMAGFTLRDSETFDEWQLGESESYRRELMGALERLARGRSGAGAPSAAIVATRRWLELDPLHEPAHRLLMTELARAGEPAAALQQYRDCVRILDRELGVGPLAETTAVAEAIRSGGFAVAAPSLVDRPTSSRTPPGTGDRPRPRAPDRASSTPLIGRDDALAALQTGYDGIGPDGRLLVIEGEPGIGKTRLGDALASAVRPRGAVVLEGRAYPGEQTIALAPIAELIRAGLAMAAGADRLARVRPESLAEVARLLPLPDVVVDPSVATLLDPNGQVRLFEALIEVLVALTDGPQPGLIWIDDLGWADASTIELVAYLGRRLGGRPVGILATWRTEEMRSVERHRIVDIPELDGRLVGVQLDRFRRADVAALAGTTLGPGVDPDLVDRLFERSEGLPLYVVAALAAPVPSDERIPSGVLALLTARIEATGQVAGQVLAAAAAIGRSFDLETVRSASGRTDEETVDGLDELMARGLIREVDADQASDVRYDFTHGRLRDVAYDRLSLARRRLLHARVAEALTQRGTGAGTGVDRWALIANHETLAGRTGLAADAHRRAGDQARSIFANAEARQHLEAALALGHPAVAEIHEALGDVLTLLGDYDGALAHLETAVALAGPEREAAIDQRLGLVLARRGDWPRAESHLLAALGAVGPDGDPVVRSRILADRSAVAQRRGDLDGAESFAEEARSIALAADDGAGEAQAEDRLGIVARSRGDLGGARLHLERAIAAIDRVEAAPGPEGPVDPGLRVAALNTLALISADEGDRERALALTREALARCELQGDRHRQAALENNLADLLQATGRGDEAMAHLKRAVALFAEVGGRPGELEPEIWKLVEW